MGAKRRISNLIIDELVPPTYVDRAFVTLPELIEITGVSRMGLLRRLHRIPHVQDTARGHIRFPLRLVLKTIVELGCMGEWPKPRARKKAAKAKRGAR